MLHSSENKRPIGLFDSGIGGLTVLQQLICTLPHENFVYFGDTARLPYGDKSRETIIRYSLENADFLLEKNIKMLVVPCNTATAFALDELQKKLSIPVIGVIDPSAECAVMASKTGRIGVLGTRGTILSKAYQNAILKYDSQASIFPIACPLFVPLVEENFVNHPAAKLIVNEYLRPLASQQVDTLLLGCTHYPLLKSLIAQEVGKGVNIIDSASSCAEKVASILKQYSLKNHSSHPGSLSYFVSDDPHKFQAIGHSLLNMSIDQVMLTQSQSQS